jgi:arylsulfatase A-like enzyme/Tfp pilus assembly protein PilF
MNRYSLALTTALAIMMWACQPSSPSPLNLLIVTFDTTRADHIGCYGNDTVKTPTLDRLASEGVRFAKAYSSIPLTTPSHSSILTGLYPISHGVRDNGLFVLADEQTTLAEILSQHGFATAAAIGSFPLVARFGLDQGFDLFDDEISESYEDFGGRRLVSPRRLYFDERKAARVNDAVFPWLEQQGDDPFFLWVHYYDPHQPHDPPKPYNDLYATDPYDGEIAYSDESLGLLLDRLDTLDLLDNTLIVFTSDHGEGMGEHQEQTHSYLLYDTTLHVPLIIKTPGGASSRVVQQRVALVDIMPTVLDLLGLPLANKDDVDGRSLRNFLEAEELPTPPEPTHYAETLSPRLAQGWGELRALYDGRFKYIHGPRSELFDIENDPDELTNLLDQEREHATRLRDQLQLLLDEKASTLPASTAGIDEETMKKLISLGYVQSGLEMEPIKEVLRSDGIPPQDRVQDVSLISQAKNMLLRGQSLGAKEATERLLLNDPSNAYYLQLMAHATMQLGQFKEAQAVLEQLIEQGSSAGSPELLLMEIGKLAYYAGDLEEGMRTVRKSIAAKPTAQGYYLLSVMLAQEDQIEAALAALNESLELNDTYAPALVDQAIRLDQQGHTEAARAAFTRAATLHPYYAKAHHNYGAFLAHAGEFEPALGHFSRAIELDTRYAQAYYAAIATLIALERPEQANEYFTQLERYAPQSDEITLSRELLEDTQ